MCLRSRLWLENNKKSNMKFECDDCDTNVIVRLKPKDPRPEDTD